MTVAAAGSATAPTSAKVFQNCWPAAAGLATPKAKPIAGIKMIFMAGLSCFDRR